MKNKILLVVNLLISLAVILLNALYLFLWPQEIILQGVNCALYVLLGILNFIMFYKQNSKKYKLVSVFTVLGLLFGMLGDIMLGQDFVLGASLFALGHILYFVGFVCIKKYSLKDFLVLLVLIAIDIPILLVPDFYFGKYLPVILGYAVIISVMTAKAISNFIFDKKNMQNILLFIGAVLFFVSDLSLMIYWFGSSNKTFDYICMLTYFPAQILFAISIYKFKNNERQ